MTVPSQWPTTSEDIAVTADIECGNASDVAAVGPHRISLAPIEDDLPREVQRKGPISAYSICVLAENRGLGQRFVVLGDHVGDESDVAGRALPGDGDRLADTRMMGASFNTVSPITFLTSSSTRSNQSGSSTISILVRATTPPCIWRISRIAKCSRV